MSAIHEFFRNGMILKQLNHAAITLIPKTKHEPGVADFKPISCCNVTYKTISKIIANRIAPIISNLIDPAQGEFLEDKLMH